jgi:hypothetical protein
MQFGSRLKLENGSQAGQNRLLRCVPQAPLYTLICALANGHLEPFIAIPVVHG